MTLISKEQTLLFQNEELENLPSPKSEVLFLNKERFIQLLMAAARDSKDIQQLRVFIEKLNINLSGYKEDNLGVLNITANGETLGVNPKYLNRQIKQIYQSKTLERAVYYINRLVKSLTQIKSGKINDLNLNQWKEYEDIITDSLWILNRRDNSGVHTSEYWGNFIPQIPNQMMRRFTKKGDWVLDTFLGCGTTLIECQRLGRNGIGIEIQKNIAKRAKELLQKEPNKYKVILEVVEGDSTTIDYEQLLKKYGLRKIQHIIMHPPYHDIIRFSNDSRDLSNTKTVEEFLEKMSEVVRRAGRVLEKDRYLVLVIGDKYSKGEWVPLGFLTMNEVLKAGFSLKSIIVKNFEETLGKRNQKELWRYRALVGGFYVFKHEYIFLFRKK